MNYRLYALLFLFALLPCYAAAQYPFLKKIDVEEENLTLKTNVLLKDRFGFLWIGTSEGLFKFNSTLPQKTATTLPGEQFYITALAEDKTGKIWAGCKNGTLVNITNQQLSLFTAAEGLPKTAITSLVTDKNNRLWIATAGEGIFYKEGASIKQLLSKDGLSDDNINCLYVTENNELIAGTDRGLSFIKLNGTKNEISFFTAKNGLPDNIIKCIQPVAKSDKIWIGTQSKGILQFDVKTKEIIPVAAIWPNGQVNDICVSGNLLFIATEQNGLLSYNTVTGVFNSKIFKEQPFTRPVSDIQADNEENIWLATENKMVSFTGNWLTYHMTIGNVPLTRIHTLYADNENLWLTPDLKLYKTSQLQPINYGIFNCYDITPPDELIDITSIYKDRFGYLWVGTMGKGIYRLNTVTGTKKQLTKNAVTANGHILSIAGKNNDVWVSSLNGVTKFNLAETNSLLEADIDFTNYSKKDGLGSDYVYHILIDSKNRVWFATDGAGVCVYDNNVFTNYYNNRLFPSKVAYSLTEDKRNHIWVSTYNDGLYEFTGNKFVNYNTKNGLTDLAITSVTADDFGNIIAVNKKGLDIFNPEINFVQHFGSESGFTEQQPNLNSITKDSSGNVWIGTENGIVKFVPARLVGIFPPVAIIESVLLFNNPVNTESTNNFSYNQNSFTFKVAAAYYKAPEKIKFQYWLEGYGNKWETTADRSITFSQLRPGTYTFKLRASANENFNASKIFSYSFTIKRSFWTTWWFRLLLVLLIAAITYWLTKERIKAIRKKEKMAQEKFQLQYDALKNQVNPHFLFNSFNALLNMVEEEPKEAAALIKHLSQFYRKMTAHSQKELILLEEELELLNSYIYIQKKRFGNALQFTVSIDESLKKTGQIPPLVLQLLAENAVKHNTISKEKKLHILLYKEEGYLVMKNNINPKMVDEPGEGVGLQNIKNRYRLLTEKPVITKTATGEFIIMVPLIYFN